MNKRVFSSILAVGLISAIFALPIINAQTLQNNNNNNNEIDKSSMIISPSSNPSQESSSPKEEIPKSDEIVTFIVVMENDSLLDTVLNSNGKYKNVSEILMSDDGKVYYDKIKKEQAVVKASIQKIIPQADFEHCYTYISAINGFSVKTRYSSIEKIRKIQGVKDVILSNKKYKHDDEPSESESSNLSSFTKSSINADFAYNEGYTGKNILIAVIDDSFDTSHEVFSTAPENPKYDRTTAEMLYGSVGFNTNNSYGFNDIYVNQKVIFAYDYADNDNNTYCRGMNHGTHVAGIAAGNNGKNSENKFIGMAYDAQLAFMKVCSDNKKYISSDAIIAALDDVSKLGADIINCSYGSSKSEYNDSIVNSIYEKLTDLGVYIVASAGNESYNNSISENNLNTEYIDYGTINYPSSISSVLSVGAVNSKYSVSKYFTVGKNNIKYSEVYTSNENGNIEYDTALPFREAISNENNYVYIGGYGAESSYKDVDVTDKIVIINQGITTTLQEQIDNAYANNAKALIVIKSDNVLDSITQKSLPTITIEKASDKYFKDHPFGTITISNTPNVSENQLNPKIASYSSYGVTADLKLKPEICAPGTGIYSSINNNNYDTMSGTSMSSPCVAGAVALIKQYIDNDPILGLMNSKQQNDYISSLIMSTADTVKYSGDGLYYTPRIQGAGIINLEKALSSPAYLTMNDNDKPKADILDSENGEYSFTFTIKNRSNKNLTYNLYSVIQTDKYAKDKNGNVYNTLEPRSIANQAEILMYIDEKAVTQVTVNAITSVNVTVKIKIRDDFIASNIKYFKNGFYVDGYIFLDSENGESVSLNMPFMGFCGNWSKCPIFDYTIYDDENSITGADNSLFAVGVSDDDYFGYSIGHNKYTNLYDIPLSIGKNSISGASENTSFGSTFIIPNFHLLRDAYNYKISVSDKNGKELFSRDFGFMSSYISGKDEPFENIIFNNNLDSVKNFFASLTEGEYIYTVSAYSIGTYKNIDKSDSISYNFTVDNTAPKTTGSRTYIKDGKVYLELSATDNNAVQGFELYTATYNRTNKSYDYSDKLDDLIINKYISEDSYSLESVEINDDGSTVFVYDITNLSSQLERLGTFSESRPEAASQYKIVYKAVDCSFNYSAARTADTIAYGTVEFEFKDQNNRPVSNVGILFNKTQKMSSEDGKVIFENVIPDIYIASITSVPNDYETNESVFLIQISNDHINIKTKVNMNYSGTISDISESQESSKPEEVSTEQSQNESSTQNSSKPSSPQDHSGVSSDSLIKNTGDSSIYAVFFVSTLLAISVASLVVSHHRSKR